MKSYFSGASLQAMQECVRDSLVETFQVMFCIDMKMLPATHTESGDASAYMEMVGKDDHVCLSISMAQQVVTMVADILEPSVRPHTQVLCDDVVNEICNIVSNVVRTYLISTYGVTYALSLPRLGHGEEIPEAWTDRLLIHFRITADEGLNLEMTYTQAQSS